MAEDFYGKKISREQRPSREEDPSRRRSHSQEQGSSLLHQLIVQELDGRNQRYKKKKSENLKVLDSKPGVYTQYKPYLQKDKTILKKLFRSIQTGRPGEVQTALLKRHLIEMTESFMPALEGYIASLIPLQKNISPFKATPIPEWFNADDFLASLAIKSITENTIQDKIIWQNTRTSSARYCRPIYIEFIHETKGLINN